MGKSKHLQAQNKDITVRTSEYETDFPLVPTKTIEVLGKINPDHVRWFLNQAEQQGNFRRQEIKKENFWERWLGLIFILVFAGVILTIVGAGAWVILNSKIPWLGIGIIVGGLGGIAAIISAFKSVTQNLKPLQKK